MSDSALAGRLLVASPPLGDPNFDRTVVLLLHHDALGAVGVVLNRPSEVEVEELLPEWAPVTVSPPVVFVGGPVSPDAAIGLGRTGDVVDTVDLAAGPGEVTEARLFAGYSGWDGGQLEAEIGIGAWFVLESLPEDALSPTPDDLWRTVLRRQGGRLATYATIPEDLSVN